MLDETFIYCSYCGCKLNEYADDGDNETTETGHNCCYGKVVEKDYSKSAEWCKKAAEQGNADAQNNLGVMFAKGKGVKQDSAKAVAWYKKAAEQGQDDA